MPKTLIFDLVDGTPKLVIRELPAGVPGSGEVRFRVHAIGANRADILYMQGGHYTATSFPTRIGYEACGIVDAVGPQVSDFKLGDRVSAIPFGDPRYSVAGESAITPARFLSRWTEGHSAVEAAGTWMQYMTAYFPLKEIARVGPGDYILITAASSSAGLGALQLAKVLGAKVIASTRTPKKRDFLLAVGADHVVATSDGGVARAILEITGDTGVNVVYDAVAGSFMSDYADAVATKARIFVYGALGGKPTIECPILPLIRKGATIEPYSLINYVRDTGGVDRGREFLSRALESGAIRPIIDRVFRFEEADEAYAYMESGARRGKIVMTTELGRAELR
jgi:NADPH:quinone reductase-like Zn-dependent oxidoreductase